MVELHARDPKTGEWTRRFITQGEWEGMTRGADIDPETCEPLVLKRLRESGRPPSGQ